MKTEKYIHHGVEVTVLSHIKGKHRENCLCFAGCKHFKPLTDSNCPIAQANYELCVKHNTVQPVAECPKFETGFEQGGYTSGGYVPVPGIISSETVMRREEVERLQKSFPLP